MVIVRFTGDETKGRVGLVGREPEPANQPPDELARTEAQSDAEGSGTLVRRPFHPRSRIDDLPAALEARERERRQDMREGMASASISSNAASEHALPHFVAVAPADDGQQPVAMRLGRQPQAAIHSRESRGDRSRSSSIRFDASAFERVSSNSSPVSRHNVSRYERCASVIGSSPVFHSSGSRCRAGWSVSLVAWFLMGRTDSKTHAKSSAAKPKQSISARFIDPMLLLRTDSLPSGEQWLYELKLDGYRAIAFKRNGAVHLRSRNDNDFNARYPAVVEALAKLPDNTVIDGEVVAFDQEGRPSFNALQNYGSAPAPVVYYVFDVMVLAGQNVMREPLREAARAAREEGASEAAGTGSVLGTARRRPARVHSIGEGARIRRARRQALQQRLRTGLRSGAWMKMRVNRGQEFVIGGYTRGTKTFDALVFGYYQDDKLIYAARTRNGFTPVTRAQLFKKFKGLEIDECPFANLPEARSGRWGQGLTKAKMAECVWLKPVLVGQFEFLEWTGDNHLRHSKFVGLREDKSAKDVVKE